MSQFNINNCKVCGGNEFTLDSGLYFCLECNTQSQDVRELVFDEYFGNQKATTRVLHKKNAKTPQSGSNEKITSWEVLNYVLKGITDELIDLGAKPELKIVTLQLWASYLRKLDVAFTSEEIERKPKLGYTFKRSDAEIIYGVTTKQLREKSWRSRSRLHSRSRSKSSASESEISLESSEAGNTRRSLLKKLSVRKRALASAEYSQMSRDTPLSQNQTLEGLTHSSDGAETPKRLKITKHAKELLSSSYESSTEMSVDLSEQKKLHRMETNSVRNMTVAKIGVLANIALALTNQDIQVTDFLRWVDEGHISLGSCQKFLPEGTKLMSDVQYMLDHGHMSYTSCQSLMVQMCCELEISALPVPDLNRLAERYCLELQLPGDVVSLVHKILCLVPDTYEERMSSGGRFYEAHVLAAIVVALKMLFSLDDCTEYKLSHTATQLNRVVGNQSFVFRDWMEFIECRKAVVAAYHLPTRTSVYGDSMGRDSNLFVQHYSQIVDQQQLHYRDVNKTYALNKAWAEAMTRCLSKLREHQPQVTESEFISFPASLTPLHSNCQLLLKDHPELVAAAAHILGEDFTAHSLEYILSPDRTIALGLAHDLHILQRPEGAATVFEIEKTILKDKYDLVIPRYKLNQANIKIDIIKRLEKNNYDEQTESIEDTTSSSNITDTRSSLYKKAEEIISDDSDEEELNKEIQNPDDMPTCDTVLELFIAASQYWCIHISLSKNKINNDEFNVFAMKTFPSSFLWLIKECSRMAHISLKDLYVNIVNIENKIKNKLCTVNQNIKRKK